MEMAADAWQINKHPLGNVDLVARRYSFPDMRTCLYVTENITYDLL